MFFRCGPHHICAEHHRDDHGRGSGKEHRGRPGPDEQDLRDEAGILPGHRLHSALSVRHCFDLHVRPRSLHTQERAAEAYRGRTQGDNDVLAAFNGVSDIHKLLIKTFWSNLL